MVLAGLKYSTLGISCNEEMLEALKRTLIMTGYKVANKEEAHVIGTIQYSYTVFQWDEASLTRYASLMKILNDAMKVFSAVCTGCTHKLGRYMQGCIYRAPRPYREQTSGILVTVQAHQR